MELGFNINYFKDAMARAGWHIENRRGQDGPLSSVLIAKRFSESHEQWDFAGTELRAQVGQLNQSSVIADGREGFLMHGPYITRLIGRHIARIDLVCDAKLHGSLTLDVVSHGGQRIYGSSIIVLTSSTRSLSLPFELLSDVVDLEVRIRVEAGTQVALQRLTLLFANMED